MTYEEFYIIYGSNLFHNILLTITVIFFYYLIFKKYIYSIFDPFLYNLIFSAAGFSAVFIIYYEKRIDNYYFFHFLITQICFIIGFYLIKPINIKRYNYNKKKYKIRISYSNIILYYLSSLLYIIANLYLYIKRGIPLFMPSRLSATTGGLGFLQSIIYTTSITVVVFLVSKIIKKKKFNIHDYIVLTSLFTFSVLSGSKASFLFIIFIYFYTVFFIFIKSNDKSLIKTFNKISLLIVIFSFIILYLFFILKGLDPVLSFFQRIVMTGDVYIMAYVNDNIDKINGNIINLLLPYKIVDLLNIEHVRNIGNQLVNIIYNVDNDTGPNARHNIVGYVLFGYFGSFLFSFLIGLFISYIRNKFIFNLKNNNINNLIVYVFILGNILNIETDIAYAIFNYISLFLTYTLLLVISKIIEYSFINKKYESSYPRISTINNNVL